MSSSFTTRVEGKEKEPYTVIFKTDDVQKYEHIEFECRRMLGHLKPAEEAELEAQLPKDGEWITTRTENHDGEIYCSVCDHDAPTEGDYRQVKTNYCPNCGARMKGEQE